MLFYVTVANGHNGCDTRNDILRRDLADIRIKEGTNGCVVLGGTLTDPYSGSTVTSFGVRTPRTTCRSTTSSRCPTPGRRGPSMIRLTRRQDLANDPLNLLAAAARPTSRRATATRPMVAARARRPLRAGGAAGRVKSRVRALGHAGRTRCDRSDTHRLYCARRHRPGDRPDKYGRRRPAHEDSAAGRGGTGSARHHPGIRPAAPAPAPDVGPAVYYPNCKAAKAAGAAPLYAGEPGYRIGLDRDGDGIACE